jgi:multicomponent K+:H+ antiporter subunit E
MHRLIPHPGLSVLLIIFWLLMANSLSVGGLVVAIVIGLVLPILTAPFWPGRPRVDFLAGFAYLGDMAPVQAPVTLPVTLNVD